jgi:hypothetical protein
MLIEQKVNNSAQIVIIGMVVFHFDQSVAIGNIAFRVNIQTNANSVFISLINSPSPDFRRTGGFGFELTLRSSLAQPLLLFLFGPSFPFPIAERSVIGTMAPASLTHPGDTIPSVDGS